MHGIDSDVCYFAATASDPDAAAHGIVLSTTETVVRTWPSVRTDKLDAVWLAKLNERGMLRPSFIPPAEIRRLRDLTRLRVDLTEERSRHMWKL